MVIIRLCIHSKFYCRQVTLQEIYIYSHVSHSEPLMHVKLTETDIYCTVLTSLKASDRASNIIDRSGKKWLPYLKSSMASHCSQSFSGNWVTWHRYQSPKLLRTEIVRSPANTGFSGSRSNFFLRACAIFLCLPLSHQLWIELICAELYSSCEFICISLLLPFLLTKNPTHALILAKQGDHVSTDVKTQVD